MFFELNHKNHLSISYKKDIVFRSKSKSTNELTKKLVNLIVIYKKISNIL